MSNIRSIATDTDWTTCHQPEVMLEFLRAQASDRLLRLFACACCRRIWHDLETTNQTAITVAEQSADGEVDEVGRVDAAENLRAISAAVWQATALDPFEAASQASLSAAKAMWMAARFSSEAMCAEQTAQCRMLRDIFGNPLCPALVVDTSYFAADAIQLAQQIYRDREFHLMATLADSLEEAGCKDRGILQHCRQTEGHVRGCWVLDILLGKRTIGQAKETWETEEVGEEDRLHQMLFANPPI